MFKYSSQRGFTLIELLVVIAIIGILASVVLASLNSARAKGSDAAIKANINSARAQAELYFDSQATPSYTGLCTAAGGVAPMLTAAQNAAGGAGYAVCGVNTAGSAWAMKGRLVSNNAQYYCVDSTGSAEVLSANPYSNAAISVCP